MDHRLVRQGGDVIPVEGDVQLPPGNLHVLHLLQNLPQPGSEVHPPALNAYQDHLLEPLVPLDDLHRYPAKDALHIPLRQHLGLLNPFHFSLPCHSVNPLQQKKSPSPSGRKALSEIPSILATGEKGRRKTAASKVISFSPFLSTEGRIPHPFIFCKRLHCIYLFLMISFQSWNPRENSHASEPKILPCTPLLDAASLLKYHPFYLI